MDLKNIKTMFESVGGGVTAAFLYLLTANILDQRIDAKISNFIALLISSLANFIIQTDVFSSGKITEKISFRYFIVNCIEILSNQTLIIFLVSNKKFIASILGNKFSKLVNQFYNILMRIFVTSFLFFAISYPARRFWIYK